MAEGDFVDVGAADELSARPLQTVMVGRTRIALVHRGGPFSAISGVEDMESNVRVVQRSEALRAGARGLVERSVDMARLMVEGSVQCKIVRGGRKAHRLEADEGEGARSARDAP